MISRWIRARLARALGIHSPTGHVLGTCWCVERRLMDAREAAQEPPPTGTTFLPETSTVIERPTNPSPPNPGTPHRR